MPRGNRGGRRIDIHNGHRAVYETMTTLRTRHDEKICATCGRRFEWRRRWAANWDDVRYCSARCRSRRPGPLDRQLEQEILALLALRSAGATICPSEAARRVDPSDWRRLMERTRRAARRLAAAGRIDITQSGRVVDPASFVGAIRIRLRR